MIDRDTKYKTIPKTCETCGSVFFITPSDNKRGRGKFCSQLCHRPHATKCNEGFFGKPSPEMAWVLGVVFTDGCLSKARNSHRSRLSIKSIDYQLLDTMRRISW